MHYPLFIDLAGKEVLVAGGGKIATRRALVLHENGARVTVVSKGFSKELKANKDIRLIKKDLRNEGFDLSPYFLVVTATDDSKVNEGLGVRAKKNKILINRADKCEAGDVIIPATADVRGHPIAFTTLGKDPKLAKEIKTLIENAIPKNADEKAPEQ
ncbi:MAG: bifunctional precorrin-2 dehydrogenase/sirohydrochlorin ferrochelatase [Candidatus Altiarchaeia archaeon]